MTEVELKFEIELLDAKLTGALADLRVERITRKHWETRARVAESLLPDLEEVYDVLTGMRDDVKKLQDAKSDAVHMRTDGVECE